MKVLVSSINFAPDHAGIAVYSADFPLYLVERGIQTSVVTGFPYYPKWEKRREDKGRLFGRGSYKGVDVYRGYLYVPAKLTTLARLWHELSFCVFAFCNFLRVGRPDVIVLFTPPFFLGMVGLLFKWAWRCPLAINVQDLPLDAAVALGIMRGGIIARTLQAIEGWMYRSADLVTTISAAMLDNLHAKGVPTSRLLLVPNWIDLESIQEVVERGSFLSRFPEAQGKFTLAYAGNIGMKQGLESLLRLAVELQSNGHVHIFVIGDGADKPRVRQLADELGLKNVTFLPFMSADEYHLMLADVDLAFVAQRPNAGENFLPSKILGLMARAKPLLVVADENTELSRIVIEAGCGLVSAYGDMAKLLANFETLFNARSELWRIGANGRRAVDEFDRARVLGAWYDRIEDLCAQ